MAKPRSGQGQTDDLSRFVWTGQAGDFVFHHADDVTDLFIIEAGRIELIADEATAPSVLAELGSGDSFGEGALLEDRPRDLAARVASDCKLLKIDYATFVSIVRERPTIAMHLLRRLAHRLDEQVRARLAASAAAEAAAGADAAAAAAGPARLVHTKTRRDFLLDGESVVVGRVDRTTGLAPEVDLTQLDRQRTISRRHARIRREGAEYVLREEAGVSNGTFVNDQRLQAGAEVTLRDGDRVRFGLVDTVFHR